MLEVKYIALEEIKPYEKNARTHSEKQVAQIAESIRQFGFTNPILLDKSGVLIAGHGRLEAAKLIGMKSVPAITLDNLTDTQVKALRIADNQIALNSGWNDEMLRAELAALKLIDFDIKFVGFSDETISELFNTKQEDEQKTNHLAAQFGAPPFSVLDARQGWWQTRKRQWLALGIQSEIGRGDILTYGSPSVATSKGMNFSRNKKTNSEKPMVKI